MKTTNQVAGELGIDESHIRRLARDLDPQPAKFGNSWLWTAEDIERLRARLVGRGRWVRKPKEEQAPG